MLSLGTIRNACGAVKDTKRLGRGAGSGRGGTAGKGHKGQLARSGGQSRPGFEGGQIPLYRRIPKRGFTSLKVRKEGKYIALNLEQISAANLVEVDFAILVKAGLVNKSVANQKVKILGRGDVKKAITFKGLSFTSSAKQKVEAAGGKVL